MAGAIWAIGEMLDGEPTRLTRELATLAAGLSADAQRPGATVLVGAGAAEAAPSLADHGPDVIAVDMDPAGRPAAAVVAECVAALVREREPAFLLIGASDDGRDVAGSLQAMLGWGALVSAAGVRWTDAGPQAEMSVFGGRLTTTSHLAADHGIVVVRPSAVVAQAGPRPGSVERVEIASAFRLADARVVDRIVGTTGPVAIEEAMVIVAGGRGVGGPEGFVVVEELASELEGAVGATRAVVDAGWIGYGHQIGQTGKSVRPQLYVAAGISGAIQHKVGMQTSGTIVAINRDPDAPIAEFADLMVVGDLFEILPRLSAALRSRRAR